MLCNSKAKAIFLYFQSTQATFCVLLPCAGIFKQSMGARNRVGIGLSYRPARLHSLDSRCLFFGSKKQSKDYFLDISKQREHFRTIPALHFSLRHARVI
jgi:hypothetical protein